MIQTDNTIAVVVEAENPADAKTKADDHMTRKIMNHYLTGQRFGISESKPLRVDSIEGGRLLMDLWEQQEKAYMADILSLALDLALSGDLRELLETLQFRSACYRLGSIEGYPIRIYDPMGEAVPWRSHLQSLMEGLLDDEGIPVFEREKLWVVLVTSHGRPMV